MRKSFKTITTGLFFLITLFFIKSSFAGTSLQDNGYEAVPCLMDLRSAFSDGSHTIEDLARIAHERGFRVLFINDHDRITLSYGVFPFKNILRYKKEFPSIMTNNHEDYLNEIKRVQKQYPDMIIIPGCETSPYYYWTGSWLGQDLTVNGYDRRILIMNLTEPSDYNLPILNNGLSLRYTKRLLPGAIIFLFPLIAGIIIMTVYKRAYILIGSILTLISILAIIDYNPFRSSPFSPYKGDQGIAPYQELIDYVNKKGGLSFWNYPEQKSGMREYGPIKTSTATYARVLNESTGYTGFSAIYGEYTTATKPGREWDLALMEYLAGKRTNPPWGIAAADFHFDGKSGQKLGTYPTTLLVKEFSKNGIMEALKNGRLYASCGDGIDWPLLTYFNVSGKDKAFMGETIVSETSPVISFRVEYRSAKSEQTTIMLIRGGKLIKTFTGQTPMEIEYTDTEIPSGEKTFYRIMDNKEHLLSNPIFVTYMPVS